MEEFFSQDHFPLSQNFDEQSEDWEKIEEVNRQLQRELNPILGKKDKPIEHLKKASIAGSIFNDSYLGNLQDIKKSKKLINFNK